MLKGFPYLQPPNSGAACATSLTMTAPLVVLKLDCWGLSITISEGCGQAMGNFCKFPGYPMFSQSWEPLHWSMGQQTQMIPSSDWAPMSLQAFCP